MPGGVSILDSIAGFRLVHSDLVACDTFFLSSFLFFTLLFSSSFPELHQHFPCQPPGARQGTVRGTEEAGAWHGRPGPGGGGPLRSVKGQ
ncbi:hypothetical protein IF1G_10604 [Cordyceps javanica]|uniref:Uncharacterized protein n=1 Tax=Cordyceps javanica TaxID=43265 RepID=A0A545UMG7_9HYPO|nr:hypothetical protein IF1G_10604 [Cordyceps javanica]